MNRAHSDDAGEISLAPVKFSPWPSEVGWGDRTTVCKSSDRDVEYSVPEEGLPEATGEPSIAIEYVQFAEPKRTMPLPR